MHGLQVQICHADNEKAALQMAAQNTAQVTFVKAHADAERIAALLGGACLLSLTVHHILHLPMP
jgi:hypothetical protein